LDRVVVAADDDEDPPPPDEKLPALVRLGTDAARDDDDNVVRADGTECLEEEDALDDVGLAIAAVVVVVVDLDGRRR
jgi:hypothetical protein